MLWPLPIASSHLHARASCAVLFVVAVAPAAATTDILVFQDTAIRFAPDEAGLAESGRVATATAALPDTEVPHRITAHVTLRPVPKDELSVCDPWDRAGNVRLLTEGSPDLEIIRFMTAYGGRTEHDVDVTHLAPLLRGRRTLAAFVDTWLDPAWHVDVTLRYEPDSTLAAATWAQPIFYTDSFNAQDMPEGAAVSVEIPDGLVRVVMKYFSTGHCTDGRDEDEFVSKANVISVDGVVVERFHPWRDDCRRFRELNPYTKRWADGTWSSDYSRSGWCPSQEVLPVEIDLTDHLGPGPHTVTFAIEGMRPKDENDHFGYWRVSAHLVGWEEPPALWKN